MFAEPSPCHAEDMEIINVRGVRKTYGTHPVLDGLDLTIEAGEVFALLGPNGAGKTTLVEILEGFRRADTGHVEVLGTQPANGGPNFRARIGIVLQQTTSFEKSTVAETVAMFAALFPNPLGVDEAIDLVGLSDRRNHIADSMSGGQRRRLDVACGLVGRPELLFLDEPSTGLDPEARRSMWSVINRLRDQGTTVLLTTHYMEEAEALADRIGVLLGGTLQAVGSPEVIGNRANAPTTVRFVIADATPGDDRLRHLAQIGADVVDAPLSATAQRQEHIVSITTSTPGRLVQELVSRHGELDRLTVTRPTLEETYLEMVEAGPGIGRATSGTEVQR